MQDNSQKAGFRERYYRLGSWLESSSGHALLQAEQRCLDDQLRTIFGYYACQMSVGFRTNLLKNSQVGHHFNVLPQPQTNSDLTQIINDPYFWSIEPGSIDLVVLHHVLEIAESPHRLLSEAAKTIIPDGKLIIIGFNPWSCSSLARWLVPERVSAFKGARFIHLGRLRDWLTLLGFNVEQVQYGAYTPPFDRIFKGITGEFIEQRCDHWKLPLGSFYSILATREVQGVTPIRKPWSKVKRRLVGHSIARPSAGRFGENC